MVDRYSEKARTLEHLAQTRLPGAQSLLLRVVVSDRVLKSEAGQILVLTVARLVPRTCDRIDFSMPTEPAIKRLVPLLNNPEFSARALADLAKLIWANGSFDIADNTKPDLVLGIGAPGDVSVGINESGSTVVMNGEAPFHHDNTSPNSALTAAAVAVAQITKLIYPTISGKDHRTININDGPFGGLIDSKARILDRPFIIGIGAVGCALIYALIVTGAKGSVLLLDPDAIDDSNLSRYVLFDSRHLKQNKVDAASDLIKASGIELKVDKENVVVEEYLAANNKERSQMRLAISAVDTYEMRHQIANLLPKKVLNAGTTPRDFTISRHQLGDGFACLACLYPISPQDTKNEAIMARELGLPEEEVKRLKNTKRGLSASVLKNVASSRGKPQNEYLEYVGKPIDTFYNKVFCGALPIPTHEGEAVAPFAYGSALAGFWLSHSLTTTPEWSNRHFRIDFMRGLTTPRRHSPRRHEGCVVCGRSVIRQTYKKRWPRQKSYNRK